MPRTPYYRGPVSDHFDGTRFFNPGGEAPRGLRDVWRWQREGKRVRWPAQVAVTPVVPAPVVDDLSVTMVGHATLLIQTAGLNLLTDPVWSERASPSRLAGPRRVAQPGIRLAWEWHVVQNQELPSVYMWQALSQRAPFLPENSQSDARVHRSKRPCRPRQQALTGCSWLLQL